jgi:hypothetical protein
MTIAAPTEFQAAFIPKIVAGEYINSIDCHDVEEHVAKAGISLGMPRQFLGKRLHSRCQFSRSYLSTRVDCMHSSSRLQGDIGKSTLSPCRH